MARLMTVVSVLSRLDECDVEVWRSRDRWFWAFREDLKLSSPKLSDQAPDLSAVHGPYSSSVEAALNAGAALFYEAA